MNSDRKTVLHLGVNTLFHVPGDVGGTETYLCELLKAIVAEFPEIKITLFTQLNNDAMLRQLFAINPSVAFCRIPIKAAIRPLRILTEQFFLPWAVIKSNVDILWSPGYTLPYYVHCPQVVTVHDLQYKKHPEDLTWLERMTLDILVKTACKRSSAVIAVSEFSKKEIVNHRFSPAEKVHVVLEGVDRSFGSEVTDQALLSELRECLPDDKPFILCVAHTYPHKNVHLLIDAFREIQHSLPHNLVIVGKPRLGEPAVEAAVARLGDTSRLFRMMHGVSFNLLRLLYQKADLFVLPSAYEGFGLPVLEAMMAGTPVACSREASIPEVGGKCASYIKNLTSSDLGHAIVEVLGRKTDLRTEQCNEARRWAESFTWQRAAIETVEIFETIRRN